MIRDLEQIRKSVKNLHDRFNAAKLERKENLNKKSLSKPEIQEHISPQFLTLFNKLMQEVVHAEKKLEFDKQLTSEKQSKIDRLKHSLWSTQGA